MPIPYTVGSQECASDRRSPWRRCVKADPRFRHAPVCLGLTALLLLPGCVWRTKHADYVLGPSFFRSSPTAPGMPDVIQTLHGPVLWEGGQQWGMTIGAVQRVAVVPARAGATAAPTNNQAGQPRGVWVSSEPGRWHFSLIYLRAPLRETPLLIQRSAVGVQLGGGTEQPAFSAGYSTTTATLPREHALHELDYDSRHPLEAKATVTPATTINLFTHNSTHKEQP